MNTIETKAVVADPQEQADFDAVMRQLVDGTPLDDATALRIRERALLATEELRRSNVQVDIDKLIRDVRDES
jgi:hypothetical protein